MEKKIIDLEVKDNLEPTIKNLKLLKNQLKETAAGSKEFDKLSAQIRDLDDSIADAKATNDDFLGQLENASGPLGMLGQSIRGAERTFSSFNGALKASVIGLIVALIGGLVAAFNENEVAMKKLQPLLDGMQKIFQGIFRAVEPLFNTLVDLAINALPMVSSAFQVVYSSVTAVFQSLGSLGSALLKLMKGDFKGAWSDAKASVNDFSSNYDKSVKRFSAGTKEMTKNEKEEADKRKELLDKQTEDRKKAQEKEAEIRAKALADLKEYNKQTLKEISDFNLAQISQKVQEDLEEKERSDKVLIDASLAVDNLDAEEEKKTLNSIARNKREKEDEQALADAKLSIQNAQLDNVTNGIGLLKGLFEKNKGLQKGLLIAENAAGIARTIINTMAANAKALLLGPVLAPPTILANNISAGIGIATSIAATAKGLSALGGGSAGGSTSLGNTGGGSAPAAPSFNVVGASPTNQLAQTIGNKEQQPIKAYVVSADVSTAQSLDRNIISSASLG